MYGDRDVISDRTVGSVLVVVPTPIFQLVAGIRKAHEVAIDAPLVRATMATHVQAFGPELAVEGFDEPVVGRFFRP